MLCYDHQQMLFGLSASLCRSQHRTLFSLQPMQIFQSGIAHVQIFTTELRRHSVSSADRLQTCVMRVPNYACMLESLLHTSKSSASNMHLTKELHSAS